MIFWRSSSVPKYDHVDPWLHCCDSRCSYSCLQSSQVSLRRSQVSLRRSQVLPGLLSVLPVPLYAACNVLPWSDTLLKLTHLSLHSISSQSLLKATSDTNIFRWFWRCVRSWRTIQMVQRSMRSGSSVADQWDIHSWMCGFGGFASLLSLLIVLYRKRRYDDETASKPVLSLFPRYKFHTPLVLSLRSHFCYQYHLHPTTPNTCTYMSSIWAFQILHSVA